MLPGVFYTWLQLTTSCGFEEEQWRNKYNQSKRLEASYCRNVNKVPKLYDGGIFLRGRIPD